METVWKGVEGYPDYEVSNKGNVRNINTNRVLKRRLSAQGYDRVRLYKNKVGKNEFVHRLVAIAFIPNPNNYPLVNHKDETTLNNSVENLEWCTYQYNNSYGDAGKKKGIANSKKVYQMNENGDIVRMFGSLREASETEMINITHISECCRSLRKHAGGYKWSFAGEVI